MCRSLAEGGRRCPSDLNRQRAGWAARQRRSRANRALQAANGDSTKVKLALAKLAQANQDLANLRAAQADHDAATPTSAAPAAATDTGAKGVKVATGSAAPANEDSQVGTSIRDAYQAGHLAVVEAVLSLARPGEWVSLVDLRKGLDRKGLGRAEQDELLERLSRDGQISIVPESNQKALRAEDRDAAIMIGGEPNHLVTVEHADIPAGYIAATTAARQQKAARDAAVDPAAKAKQAAANRNWDRAIEQAVLQLGPRGQWMGLIDLRQQLLNRGVLNRALVDEHLRRMSKEGKISIVPESNRKMLGQADYDAAIMIGGEANHLVALHKQDSDVEQSGNRQAAPKAAAKPKPKSTRRRTAPRQTATPPAEHNSTSRTGETDVDVPRTRASATE